MSYKEVDALGGKREWIAKVAKPFEVKSSIDFFADKENESFTAKHIEYSEDACAMKITDIFACFNAANSRKNYKT